MVLLVFGWPIRPHGPLGASVCVRVTAAADHDFQARHRRACERETQPSCGGPGAGAGQRQPGLRIGAGSWGTRAQVPGRPGVSQSVSPNPKILSLPDGTGPSISLRLEKC